MENLTEALGMGGYGVYVWPSFIVAAVVIFAMLMISLRSLRKAQKTLKDLQNSQVELIPDDEKARNNKE
ncbi:MAG: heme exporter protein CcmD [Rickettsiales bacterium]